MAPPANPDRSELEWIVLCFMCSQFGDERGTNQIGLDTLKETHFLNPVHRAIFQEIALCRARGLSQEELRQRLPESMTRRGFPDLDFEALFGGPLSSSDMQFASEIVRNLRESLDPASGHI
jgi:hypothetical protein